MSHWKDPKVNIPHYDVPPGVCALVQTREGTIACQKQEDGGWEVIYFDGERRTKVGKELA